MRDVVWLRRRQCPSGQKLLWYFLLVTSAILVTFQFRQQLQEYHVKEHQEISEAIDERPRQRAFDDPQQPPPGVTIENPTTKTAPHDDANVQDKLRHNKKETAVIRYDDDKSSIMLDAADGGDSIKDFSISSNNQHSESIIIITKDTTTLNSVENKRQARQGEAIIEDAMNSSTVNTAATTNNTNATTTNNKGNSLLAESEATSQNATIAALPEEWNPRNITRRHHHRDEKTNQSLVITAANGTTDTTTATTINNKQYTSTFQAPANQTNHTTGRIRYNRITAYSTSILVNNNNNISNIAREKQRKKKKIAIVSGYVHKDPGIKLARNYLPHLLNKACYAQEQGYDLIFNTTWGYPKERPRLTDFNRTSRYKNLDSGTWHCVPYLQAVMDTKDEENNTTQYKYDWIFWNDIDYVFQNIRRPLEEFLKDFEEHNLTNVQVLVAHDQNPETFVFSSWAVLIRNSAFGRRLLQHWRDFALGLCVKGNFRRVKYTWWTGDQPGLWYALMKTHQEWHGKGNNTTTPLIRCNPNNGYIETLDKNTPVGLEMQAYFQNVFQSKGPVSFKSDKFPRDEPIVWSDFEGGLGVNVEKHVGFRYNNKKKPLQQKDMPTFPTAFGLHIKDLLPSNVLQDLDEYCKDVHNCSVNDDFFEDYNRKKDRDKNHKNIENATIVKPPTLHLRCG